MKNIIQYLFLYNILLLSINGYTQEETQDFIEHGALNTYQPGCGSYELMENIDQSNSGFLKSSHDLMEDINHLIEIYKENRTYTDLYVIPVVFHVVYNTPEENIPDSVIFDQLEILNECFRRQNEDASETREAFIDLVGDTKIEFVMANLDPSGMPTTGITRTSTEVSHFGGILPYSPGETEEITNWVNDSLYYNFFRITRTDLGGKDPWDTDSYLNIWIGDLRVFEPEFDDFEELVYFGLATPPINHFNWPDEVLEEVSDYHQGVIIHYVNIGSNNPNSLPAPYTAYNGLTTTGKILVHETGHYLGLRHIWGDGDCSHDDYITDTPNSNASSNWNCNYSANTCVDDIGGEDLPNMIENYMDYSNGSCQNSFTIGQADLMRAVLEDYRPLLGEVVSTAKLEETISNNQIIIYPNPSSGRFSIDLKEVKETIQIKLTNNIGQVVMNQTVENTALILLDLNMPSGIYFLQINFGTTKNIASKIIIE